MYEKNRSQSSLRFGVKFVFSFAEKLRKYVEQEETRLHCIRDPNAEESAHAERVLKKTAYKMALFYAVLFDGDIKAKITYVPSSWIYATEDIDYGSRLYVFYNSDKKVVPPLPSMISGLIGKVSKKQVKEEGKVYGAIILNGFGKYQYILCYFDTSNENINYF
jgi:hypothetical protein